MGWIHLAGGKFQWISFVIMIMEFRVQ